MDNNGPVFLTFFSLDLDEANFQTLFFAFMLLDVYLDYLVRHINLVIFWVVQKVIKIFNALNLRLEFWGNGLPNKNFIKCLPAAGVLQEESQCLGRQFGRKFILFLFIFQIYRLRSEQHCSELNESLLNLINLGKNKNLPQQYWKDTI